MLCVWQGLINIFQIYINLNICDVILQSDMYDIYECETYNQATLIVEVFLNNPSSAKYLENTPLKFCVILLESGKKIFK